LQRFRDIGLKSLIVTYPTSVWRPSCGWPCWNFVEIFGLWKL